MSAASSILTALIRPFGRLTKGFVPTPTWDTLEIGAGLTLTDDETNGRAVLAVDGSAPPAYGALAAASLSLGAQTPPQDVTTAKPSQSTTAASTVTLATIALPAGKTTFVMLFATGSIVATANVFTLLVYGLFGFTRIGSGAPSSGPPVILASAMPLPFSSTPGNTGSFGGIIAGNNVAFQCFGLGTPSAWGAGTFVPGNLVTKSGNVYIVASIAGTGTSTAGPSGTGLTTDNAGGNQVVWDTLTVGGTGVPILWGMPRLELMTP